MTDIAVYHNSTLTLLFTRLNAAKTRVVNVYMWLAPAQIYACFAERWIP